LIEAKRNSDYLPFNREEFMELAKWSRLVTIASILFSAFSVSAVSQENAPSGESVSQNWVKYNARLTNSNKDFRIDKIDYNYGTHEITTGANQLHWTPPKGTDIIYTNFKTGNSEVVLLLLSDGSIYETVYDDLLRTWDIPRPRSKTDPTNSYQAYKKIAGDALYVLSNIAVYVSRDAGGTWKVDTAGVGGPLYYDLALDTSQYVWLAHLSGLWKQHPDSNTWRKVSSFPVSSATTVFVDRKNRILAGYFGQLYFSTNGGTTWTDKTTGLGGQSATMFCDDAFGNLYAASGTQIWKSAGGTQPWSRIDQSFSSLSNDPSVSPIFNSISGDSLLYAATVFGGFLSLDGGATWLRDSVQSSAGFIYGLVKTASGKVLTSTNLGVFAKNSPSASWSKVFPSQGYLPASPLFLDGSGSLYTLGAKINPANGNSVRSNWKSTDGGVTWNSDSLGLGSIGAGQNQIYWVDETGVQHLAGYTTPAKMYSKSSGKAWAVDTSGYGKKTSDYPTAFGSDKRGNLYAAMLDLVPYTGILYRRAIAGGSWVADTAGLGGAQVYWITVDRGGNVILGTYTGVYRRSGNAWSKIPSPPGLDGYNAFVVSVDSTGALVAGFSTLAGLNYAWRGVYATRNNGASWTYLGLDSLSVRGLVSYGDTTYAYTYADGFYKLRSPSGGTNSIAQTDIPALFELDQNYPNPFNPTTLIRFSVPQRSRYSLKIFDILGREIAQLLDQELDAGVHEVQFDATRYSSGVYFYQLQAGAAVLTRKLVLLK
jgi:hypothetical protein